MDIPERIQEIARINNISISELAERVGIHRATLHTYVKGAAGRKPAKFPVDMVGNFLDAFPSLNIEWFVLGIGQMNIDSHSESALISSTETIEKNVDFKVRYYEATDKIIHLQERLIDANQELIACLKASKPVDTTIPFYH